MWNKGENKELDALKEYWELFLTFAKIGVMTFGGGAAMLPMLQREILDKRNWAKEELMDYYAIGQCTPGIIAVNTATFVGQKRKGDLGGIVATMGIVFPSLVIIIILAGIITTFSHLGWVQNAFAGIRACVAVQILNAVVKLAKRAVVDGWTAALFVAVFACSAFTGWSPIWFVLCSALAGIVIHLLGFGKGGQRA